MGRPVSRAVGPQFARELGPAGWLRAKPAKVPFALANGMPAEGAARKTKKLYQRPSTARRVSNQGRWYNTVLPGVDPKLRARCWQFRRVTPLEASQPEPCDL
jgi:hypothetical protein